MDLFAKRNPEKRQRAFEIKSRVEDLLALGADATVMVTELNCQDEDCPEVETVIAVLRPGRRKAQVTLPSCIEQVADEEIERFCRTVLEAPQPPDASPGASE